MSTKQAYRTHYSMYWLCILLALLTVPANALEIPAKPPSHVVDLAKVIDSAYEQKLNAFLTELGHKTTANIVVLTVHTTAGESIEQFSLHIANDLWKLGDAKENNGLLVLIAVKDRRYRIEVGMGLEKTLPDEFCHTVGEQYFVPNFRAGHFGKGTYEGTLTLANKVAQHYGVEGADISLITSAKYLEAHNPAVRSLAISPEKTMLASGDDQGKIVFWSLPDLRKLKTISLEGSCVKCLAFSSNGRYLYAPGESLADFDMVEIDLKDYSVRRLSVGSMGTILAVCPSQDSTKLATVTASNELLVNELQPRRPDEAQIVLRWSMKRKIFGGFIREAVFSDNKRFLAVMSQNEIDNRGAPPQELTILDLEGKAETSYTFKSSRAYHSSTMCFSANSRALWLYTTSEPIRVFRFDEKEQDWTTTTLDIRPSKSHCSASCTGGQDNTLFLAAGKRIGFLDMPSKRLRKLTSLSIGEGGKFATHEIEALLWIADPARLVAALQDGRLAVITLPTAEQGPKSIISQADKQHAVEDQSRFLGELEKEKYDETAVPTQAPVFRWDFSKKDVHTYTYEQEIRIKTDMGGVFGDSSGDDEEPGISAKHLLKGLILVKSQADGTATLVMQDMKASMEMHPGKDREPKTTEQAMPPLVVQDMKEDGSTSFGDSSSEILLRLIFPLPSKTLNVGEAIDVPAQMPFNAMGSRLYVKGRLRITLRRYVKIADRTCAQFDVNIDISELKVPSELEGEYKCSTKGESVFYFDVSKRRFVSGTTAVQTGFSIDAPAPKIKIPGVEVSDMPKRRKVTMMSDNLIRVALRE